MSISGANKEPDEVIGVPAEMAAAASVVSNWGRWGAEDELGTLNYISPDHIRRAGELVRKGVTFSLSVPFDALVLKGRMALGGIPSI
jgi:hypothetical protein